MPKLSNFGAFFKTIPMHRIYFDKRAIIICRPEEAALTDPNAVELHLRNAADVPSYISLFESTPTLDRIYIPSDDPESTYKAVCGEFKEVNAAGGLVSNRRGDFLLIRRDGLWDLGRCLRACRSLKERSRSWHDSIRYKPCRRSSVRVWCLSIIMRT